jgi:hypothetical protein
LQGKVLARGEHDNLDELKTSIGASTAKADQKPLMEQIG